MCRSPGEHRHPSLSPLTCASNSSMQPFLSSSNSQLLSRLADSFECSWVQPAHPTHPHYPTLTRRLGISARCTLPRRSLHPRPELPGLSLLAMSDQIRAWIGGAGRFKFKLNYVAGFPTQRLAVVLRYQQITWVPCKTVARTMNVFAVFEAPDGGRSLSCLLPRSSICMRPSELGLLIHSYFAHITGRRHTPP